MLVLKAHQPVGEGMLEVGLRQALTVYTYLPIYIRSCANNNAWRSRIHYFQAATHSR